METSASSPCSGPSCPDDEADPDSAGGGANELGVGGAVEPGAGGGSSSGGGPASEGSGGGAIELPDGGINGGNNGGTAGGGGPDGSGGGGSGGAGGAGGVGQGGSGPQTGTGGTGTPPGPLGGIGAPCTSDLNCSTAPGFRCIASSSNVEFGGGGPEGGYCSVVCRSNAECFAIDGDSGCGLIDPATGSGFCISLCSLGASDDKCGDRAQACYPTTDPDVGACFPMCRSDEGCGPGRFCDPGGFGLCVDAPPPGGGIGAPCTAANAEAACASDICLIFPGQGGQNGFCSANCTFGSLAGCGFAPGATAPREAACLQAQLDGGDVGDVGYCFELCDVATDCAQNSWVCRPFGDAALAAALGRQGQCVPPQLAAAPP